MVHDWMAPGLLVAVLSLHIAAVLEHYYLFGQHREDAPRMLR
jgi:hypothetical protein